MVSQVIHIYSQQFHQKTSLLILRVMSSAEETIRVVYLPSPWGEGGTTCRMRGALHEIDVTASQFQYRGSCIIPLWNDFQYIDEQSPDKGTATLSYQFRAVPPSSVTCGDSPEIAKGDSMELARSAISYSPQGEAITCSFSFSIVSYGIKSHVSTCSFSLIVSQTATLSPESKNRIRFRIRSGFQSFFFKRKNNLAIAFPSHGMRG